MKSILQLDRENQLDRQRRLLFCWCYARIEWHSAQTWRSRYWGCLQHDQTDRQLVCSTSDTETVLPCRRYGVVFAVCSAMALYCGALVVYTRRGFSGRHGTAGTRMHSTYEECEENEKIYLSAEMQQSIAQKVREELLRQYRFQANNVDKDFTAAEQAAAQEKLRQILALPVEL